MDKKVLNLEKSIEKPEVSSYFAEKRTILEDQHTSAKHIQKYDLSFLKIKKQIHRNIIQKA